MLQFENDLTTKSASRCGFYIEIDRVVVLKFMTAFAEDGEVLKEVFVVGSLGHNTSHGLRCVSIVRASWSFFLTQQGRHCPEKQSFNE
jgi:hypothetical protein